VTRRYPFPSAEIDTFDCQCGRSPAPFHFVIFRVSKTWNLERLNPRRHRLGQRRGGLGQTNKNPCSLGDSTHRRSPGLSLPICSTSEILSAIITDAVTGARCKEKQIYTVFGPARFCCLRWDKSVLDFDLCYSRRSVSVKFVLDGASPLGWNM